MDLPCDRLNSKYLTSQRHSSQTTIKYQNSPSSPNPTSQGSTRSQNPAFEQISDMDEAAVAPRTVRNHEPVPPDFSAAICIHPPAPNPRDLHLKTAFYPHILLMCGYPQ